MTSRYLRPALCMLGLLALTLSGCDSSGGYPPELAFPARTDLIVNQAQPIEVGVYTGQPGHLEDGVAHFAQLGGKTLDPKQADPADRTLLQDELTRAFGSPAAPHVELFPEVAKEDEDGYRQALADLKLDAERLTAGSVIYRRQCLHCHGVAGDGRGPTGPWVSPHPRDFRQGEFKFLSTATDLNGRKPRRADLLRTLTAGIEGTSMPSFALQTDQELDALVSYVVYLSLRGQVEFETLRTILDPSKGKDTLEGGTSEAPATTATHARVLEAVLLKQWSDSNQQAMQPLPYPYASATREERDDAIRRGYESFTSNKADSAGCLSCHQDFGRQVNYRYDAWGTLVRPANLTLGVYRGGRRPVDLFYRVKGGIPPSQMPSATLQTDGADDPKKFWDLIEFVQALPYPAMLPQDVRDKVYPPPPSVP